MLTTEQLIEIYEKESQNMPSAGEDAKTTLGYVQDALDDYRAALTYETFLWAYALGYEAGQKEGAQA